MHPGVRSPGHGELPDLFHGARAHPAASTRRVQDRCHALAPSRWRGIGTRHCRSRSRNRRSGERSSSTSTSARSTSSSSAAISRSSRTCIPRERPTEGLSRPAAGCRRWGVRADRRLSAGGRDARSSSQRAIVTPGYAGPLFGPVPELVMSPAEQVVGGLRIGMDAVVTRTAPRDAGAIPHLGRARRACRSPISSRISARPDTCSSSIRTRPRRCTHIRTASSTSGPMVTFGPVFPAPGRYKMWAQFQRRGEVVTARVRHRGAATVSVIAHCAARLGHDDAARWQNRAHAQAIRRSRTPVRSP